MTNQPEPSLREQWQHLVFRLLGGSDIAYTVNPVGVTKERKLIAEQFYPELMALYKADKEAAVREAQISERKLFAKALYKLGVNLHTSAKVIAELPELTHPQASEPDHLTQVSFCPVCKTMTHTHNGVCTRCGELKAGEGEGK